MREGKESQKSSCMIRMYNVSEYYKILEKVGRGTYGTVYKARGLKDNKFYAIKKLENNDVKLQQQGFPITALRGTLMIVSEITLLKQIDHPNIIKLKEIILSRPNKRNLFRGSTFLVFEYMDHDFAGLFKMRRRFEVPEMKCIFKQLIEGVAYLHRNKILHRDIKSANILLNDDGEVKLADFGLGRKVRLESIFTYKVVTLWYRAPELLLGHKHYSNKIDVWSIGCVVAEFLTGEVLFKSKHIFMIEESQHAQMERIYEICGDFQANDLHISEEASKTYQYFADMKPKKPYKKAIASYFRGLCPHITDITIQFLEGLLSLDPSKRLSCEEALRHPYFNEKPLACTNREIQKQEYECHEMFKDRSIKIERPNKKDHPQNSKNSKPAKEEKSYKQYHKKQKSFTPQSKKREFSSSSSRSSHTDSVSKARNKSKSKSRSRSRERQHRRRSKSREDNGRRYPYNDKRHRDRQEEPRKDRYRRDFRDDRKDRREDFKPEKERRVQEKEDKYYREKPEKKYKDDRRKEDRYDRYDQRRDTKEDRREMKQDRRQPKEDRRQPKEDRRDLKEDRRDAKDDRRQREKDDRRERRPEYRRDSKQKKYDKYQKGRYDARYQAKPSKYRNDQQKDYKRRQQRKEKDHQSKYQASKQKYSDYRSQKKSDKFVFVRQKGHRKKQVSSSSSSSSYSSHHYKKQKQHRSKYSYDRKAYYKKQHSSSGSRGYH